ncbi:hypothetical protein SeMB42_g00756 [Synchytrium endobioticum]|uniref:CBF1-interacting co-repressor CIR N-terminal domain-containing protein n=1 Tax=Synchytrium endobioticum TaxID=286115 RepID=A0A507DQJ7_9FUNG|nr:hypothetical protein SeLEV6574_g03391 [Synchytrium endobioticum]TPX53467.1 hypothetical protein SeMB42_g00756 [Synchytrium endobioticum]
MGGGDLNLKKSWHPATLRNIEKVWKLERKAEDEKKKLDQLRKEKEEERQLAELQALQEAAGLRKRSERLDWMYAAGPSGSASLVAEEKEAYLLGKKRVDKVVDSGSAPANAQLVPEATPNDKFDSSARLVYGMTANTIRDTQAKIRDDPLLAIKKREQASLQAVLANPIKVKKMKQELGIDESSSKKKDTKSKRHRKRHHSDDEGSNSDEDVKRRRRRASESVDRGDYRSSREETYSQSGRRHARRRDSDDDDIRCPNGGGRRYSERREHDRDMRDHNIRDSSNSRRYDYSDRTRHDRDKDDAEKERQRKEKLKAMMEAADFHEQERKERVEKQRAVDAADDLVDGEARKRRMKETGSMGQGFIMDMHRNVYGSSQAGAAEMIQRNKAFAQKGSTGDHLI